MTNYGVATDYEYGATHKRERLTVWSSPLMSTWEAEGYSLPKGDGYMLTTYNGDKVRVSCPTPRNDENYRAIDAAIGAALDSHHKAAGRFVVGPASQIDNAEYLD